MTDELEKDGEVLPPAVLSTGFPGSGKTYALATLAAHPKIEKLICLFTDAGGEQSVLKAFRELDVPVSKLHYAYVSTSSPGWDNLEQMAEKINAMTYESLANLKAGINKNEHRQIFEVLGKLANFKCKRTGEELGPADDFPDTWAFALDGLTGINKMCRELTVGSKPTLHQGEWGVAMGMEESFIRKVVDGMNCPRVIISHLKILRDELIGRNLMQPSLLGTANNSEITTMFSDIIYSKVEGGRFKWSTVEDNIALKSRHLTIGDDLVPDYRPLIDEWLVQKEFAEAKGGESLVDWGD